jgi:hypothetical protein
MTKHYYIWLYVFPQITSNIKCQGKNVNVSKNIMSGIGAYQMNAPRISFELVQEETILIRDLLNQNAGTLKQT